MRFSQVFLKDKIFIEKIINFLEIKENDVFLEVGPGNGEITKEIIKKGAIVIAIEIDYNLFKAFKEKFYLVLDKKLFLFNEDFLKFNINNLSWNKFRFFSNLPYHITHNALFKITQNKEKFLDIHIMLQKEVADKIIKEKNYLSYLINYHFEIKELLVLPPSAFYPKPKVFSSFLKLLPKNNFLEKSLEEELFKIIKISFKNRRKKLKNILKLVPKEYENKRPEELSLNDFINLVYALKF
jgi:16S rRNA (adenine1518-N6/adenine1519-N6)-dimethyltransferase